MSWIDQYRSKLVTAREAVACVESGMRVYIHPGCAEPEALVEALMGRAPYRQGRRGHAPADHRARRPTARPRWRNTSATTRCSSAATCARR